MASTGYSYTPSGIKSIKDYEVRNRNPLSESEEPHRTSGTAKHISRPRFPRTEQKTSGLKKGFQVFKRLLASFVIIFITFYVLGLLVLGVDKLAYKAQFSPPDFETLIDLQEKMLEIREEHVYREGLDRYLSHGGRKIKDIITAANFSGLASKKDLINELLLFHNQIKRITVGLHELTRVTGRTLGFMIRQNDYLVCNLKRISDTQATQSDQKFLVSIWSTALMPFHWSEKPQKVAVIGLFLEQVAFSHEVVHAQIKECEALNANLQKLEDLSWNIYALEENNAKLNTRDRTLLEKTWPWAFAFGSKHLAIQDLSNQTKDLDELMIVRAELHEQNLNMAERLHSIAQELEDLGEEVVKPVLDQEDADEVSMYEQLDIVIDGTKRLRDGEKRIREKQNKIVHAP